MMLSSRDIAKLGEIATLLEVSGYPKPGNVHRTQNFDDMEFEDFLISSVFIRDNLERVADKAAEYYPFRLNKMNIGEEILSCVESFKNLANTNTNLGISMLLVPIAASCGVLQYKESIESLPLILDNIIKNTTVDDALALSKAIVVSNAGGLDDKTSKYDVKNEETVNDIIKNNVTLYDLLRMSSMYDSISYELINGLPVISKIGYPTYAKLMNDYSRNQVTVEIFLNILSNVPDTLISRKYGRIIAENVSNKAKDIMDSTKIGTKERFDALNDFDIWLRSKKYNPGTTADFTAASLFVGLVDKYFYTGL